MSCFFFFFFPSIVYATLRVCILAKCPCVVGKDRRPTTTMANSFRIEWRARVLEIQRYETKRWEENRWSPNNDWLLIKTRLAFKSWLTNKDEIMQYSSEEWLARATRIDMRNHSTWLLYLKYWSIIPGTQNKTSFSNFTIGMINILHHQRHIQ